MEDRLKKIVNIFLGLILISILVFWYNIELDDSQWNTKSIRYINGKVIDILEDSCKYSTDLKIYMGYQKLKVSIKDKNSKVVDIDNYVTPEHNIYVKKGTNVIVLADEPENIEPFYSIYNYDRTFKVFLYIFLFVALLVFIGKSKGIKSAFSLFVSLFLIMFFMIPMIYIGHSPIIISIITCILCSLYSILINYGYTKMSMSNLISISLGYIIATILIYIVNLVFKISGFNLEDVEGLMLISRQTGLQLKGLLFASILVSCLGASMDVSISITSALKEIVDIKKDISFKKIVESGMNIGHDIIGTTVNTLIFAFLGSSLVTILIFISYGVRFNQLISSDFFAVEVIQGITGTLVVILLVPLTSFISGFIYTKKN